MNYQLRKFKNLSWPTIVSIVLIISGILLRFFHFLLNRSLWHDEAHLALNFLSRGPLELFYPLDHNQGAPILFLLLVEAATIIFGHSERALRLVPFLASIITLPLFYFTCKLFLHRWSVPIAVFIFAFSYRLVYFSQELKQYSIDVAVVVALTYLSFRLLKIRPPISKVFHLLVIFGCFSIFLSHPSIFILAAISSVLIYLQVSQRLPLPRFKLLLGIACWGLCFCVNYLIFLRPLSNNAMLANFWIDSFLPFPVSMDAIKIWFNAGEDYLSYLGFKIRGQGLVIVLVTVAVVTAMVKGSLSTILISLFIVIPLAAAALGKYPFSGRLSLFLSPALILLMVKGMQILSKRKSKYVVGVLAFFLLISSYNFSQFTLFKPIYREETRSVLAYLNSHHETDDLVYIYWAAENAVEYYDRNNLLLDDYLKYGNWYFDEAQYKEEINKLKRHPRVWFVFTSVWNKEEDFFLSHIDGKLLDKHEEYGASLYLFSFADDDSKYLPEN